MANHGGCCGDSSSSSSSSSSCSSSSSSSSDCSSSSSSSSSSSCDPCEAQRVENVCNFTAQQIYRAKRDAVVGIQSEVVLTSSAAGVLPPSLANLQSVFISGNGFFIKKHLIVCPAHLVLIPPTVLTTLNRYPTVTTTTPVPTNLIPNVQQRVSRILVNVYNVNGGHKGYGYEATLLGVYGVGDIALLSIDFCSDFNRRKPKIEDCHPYFSFGRVRDPKKNCDKGFLAHEGDPAFAIGNFTARLPPNGIPYNDLSGALQITKGIVSYRKHADYAGWAQPELIVVDFETAAPRTGLPIINRFGCVIGLQTLNMNETLPTLSTPALVAGAVPPLFPINVPSGDGLVGGISEFFMRRIIKALKAGVDRCASSEYRKQLVLVTDDLGDYYRYTNGYAGIAWTVVTARDYNTTTSAGGVVSVNLAATGGFAPVTDCTKLEGIRVVTLAGDATVTYATVPGATAASPPYTAAAFVNSPFLGLIAPGDIITHANCCPLGDLQGQITPLTLTKCCRAGHELNLAVRRQSENFASLHEIRALLIDFPPLMDYPWYKVNAFPYVAPVVPVVGLPANSNLPLSTFHPAF